MMRASMNLPSSKFDHPAPANLAADWDITVKKPHVGTPSERRGRGPDGKKANPKATFQRAMTDASALNIRNRDHPLNRWVTEMIEMLDLSMLQSLVGDQLNGRLDEATADKLFGDHLKPQERAKAYAFASSLGSLPPGLIADRTIIEPAHALRRKLWTQATLALAIVARLDRQLSLKLWDLTAPPKFEFEAFLVGPRGAHRSLEIANHAERLLNLQTSHPFIFDDVMAGRFLKAFASASAITTKERDRTIRCIATQFVVSAIEHSQRAHGWMVSVRRCCVPGSLQHEVTAAGSLQIGGVTAIERKLSDLAAKYLRRYDASLPADQKSNFRGGKGNIDLMLRKIIEERFAATTAHERELWHRLVATLVDNIRLAIPANQDASADIASELDVMTYWFGSTERELLLCIDLRVAQARSIARSIIANPELACRPDLGDFLYPQRLPDKKMGMGSAAQRICVDMIGFAQAATSATNSDITPLGNRKGVDRACDLLASMGRRRQHPGLRPTRAEMFFDAFDPLLRPPRSQLHTYRPGGPDF